MSFLNLGIVAHVDAGKTSLTERLLFEAGAIEALGRVDDGTTHTDSLDLERRRGITIRAAVTSCALDDLKVTVIDTPGHPDFIAEVERSLVVLDAAVLVISAVEGIQPQTVVIWRALQRLKVPTLLFVNKIDRHGADLERVQERAKRRLSERIVPLVQANDLGTTRASVHRTSLLADEILEAVAEADDDLLRRFLSDRPIADHDVKDALRRQVADAVVTPLLAGSARTGAGLPELRAALVDLLPQAPTTAPDLAATVFAVDRDERGRRSWIRLWSGQIRERDRVTIGSSQGQLVTEIRVSRPGGLDRSRTAGSGDIAVLRGLANARIGDTIGRPPARRTVTFPPATLQALVEPVDPTHRTALYTGLSELADEDPLIDLRLDTTDGEAAVSLHGEVQKEVIAALLLERYGVAARFLPTSTVCIERVVGIGTGVDRIKQHGNPYLATLGLRVEPATAGHGVEFSPGIERGNLPRAFIEAAEAGVRAGLRQGPSGWKVTDCVVTMTESGYWPRQSRPHQKFDKSMSTVAADFRLLAPVVLAAALAQAGTRVCRPIEAYELEVPEGALGSVTSLIGRHGGSVLTSHITGDHLGLSGHLPSGEISALTARLPDLTAGEGVWISRLDHFAPAPRPEPSRPRKGPDPLDREIWFRDMPR
ncbi:elongation factor G [Demetria terragena]|uniref:elongation factor G n=1 Tax=Demetria terragena TaxID=63959 RepID=UPI00036BF500|nr:TetM/TetW/TetO/TetS family tetracycline resistance ribosomal protection protein [Demetria terragena]